ncbi:MAG: hypothetical protein RSD27_08125 [Ruthenibacterium sp.]
MSFDAGTWWLVGILLTALLGVVGALIGRSVFKKIDETSVDIKNIKQDYTPRTVHVSELKEVREELKGEMRHVRDELKSETRKLASDVEDIKENCLRKDDFIRLLSGLERKVDRLMEMQMNGGNRNG